MLLSTLWNLYNQYTGAAKEYSQREKRIRAVYDALLPESDSFHDQKEFLKVIADEYSNGRWKGKSRKTFDEKIDTLMDSMNPCDKKLDKYCDDLNTAAQTANRRSGDYIPLITDVWTQIQNWTN